MHNQKITHFSASQLLQPTALWMFKYLYLQEERNQIIFSENAAIGKVCHESIQMALSGYDLAEACKEAQVYFDFEDANKDEAKRIKFRGIIPDIVKNGYEILKENGFDNAHTEVEVNFNLTGIDYPILGYVDLFVENKMFCEIKIKPPRKTKIKKDGTQGWSKQTLPKAPQHNHLLQSALYHKALNVSPCICYVNEAEAVFFTPYNCDELRYENFKIYLEEMTNKALIRQNLLKYSDQPRDLAKIIDPEFMRDGRPNFYWDIGEEYLEEARKLWKF